VGMTTALSPRVSAGHANAVPVQRRIGGRYQILRQLKNGRDTETLLASDLETDATVVIKTAAAASFSASVRMRLEHEAHVLSKVKNGSFELLLDHGAEGEHI